ncbi:MAG: three-Cys-motif partner protein TcmP [Terriglobia bacterium]
MAEIIAEDDGLPCSEVGAWAEDKYTLVGLYDRLFSTGMKNKWPTRVYIDLYSGPGFVRVRGTSRMLMGSPLLALGVPDPFDKYIFCESAPELLGALQSRVNRYSPGANATFICGDCNEKVEEISAKIPKPSPGRGVLTFCFVDPFDISVKFSTVRRLSSYFIDFLILLALHVDANRNLEHYFNSGNSKVEEFLGLPDWRERWRPAERGGARFPRFLAEEYSGQMEKLGYLRVPWDRMKQVFSDEKKLPLYRLALFSRKALADKYWDEVLKYSSDQKNFDFSQ